MAVRTGLPSKITSIYPPSLTATPSISKARSWSASMTDGMQDFDLPVHQAFDELLLLYRMLDVENGLLRGQLRWHPVGERQIRETNRKMKEFRGNGSPATPERLMALLAS